MRLALFGSLPQNRPRVLVFTEDGTFDKSSFPDYNYYDVICIGAGGGRGGGYYGEDSENAGNTIRTFGGEGGGGGFHRVRGVLDALDDTIDYTIGVPGAAGVDKDDLSTITDGEDGSASVFGGFAAASGGKGGLKSLSSSIEHSTGANGGDGGIGGQGVAGYGAKGGLAGTVDDPEAMGDVPGTAGGDGILRQSPYEFLSGYFTNPGLIGEGGGGGAGGLGLLEGGVDPWVPRFPFPTRGGRGSYNLDERVYGPSGEPTIDPDTGLVLVPGVAGGARATPLTNSWAPYGGSNRAGIIALRLTVE